jgi:ribosomal protein S25
MSISERILSLLSPIRQLREELETEKAELEERLSLVKADIAVIDKMFDSATRAKNGSQPVRQKGQRKKQPQVVTESIKRHAETLLEIMLSSDKEDWVVTEIAEEAGIHTSTANSSMRYLREQGDIRPTRKVRGGGFAYATYPEE